MKRKLVSLLFLLLLLSNSSLVGAVFIDCLNIVNLTTIVLTSYDYIIVGGGSSGSILANRLSNNTSNRVLLIEGGGRATGYFGGPDVVTTKGTVDANGIYTSTKSLTRYDVPLNWQSCYLSGPVWGVQPTYPTGTPSVVPRVAKVLGGCGAHNGMTYQRGKSSDYDNWGVANWTWSDMQPYFDKVETILDADLATSPNHGHSGKIKVKEIPFDSEGSNLLAACNASGLPFNSDFNSPMRDGCGYFQFNIDADGVRSSPVQAYLEEASTRSNLDILINAVVTKVDIQTQLITGFKIATGVEFYAVSNPSSVYTAHASKEVILSAGALNTPKILMHSGIGNSTYLSAYSSRIPTVWSNLPGVGKNLQNHFLAFTVWNYSTCPADRPNYYQGFTQDLIYSISGGGIKGNPGYTVGAWLRPNATTPGGENIMMIMPGTVGTNTPFVANTLAVSIGQPAPNSHYIELTSGLGSSLLDFWNTPANLHFTLLNQQADIDTLIRGIRESRRIMSFPPMGAISNSVSPDSSLTSDADLQTWLMSNVYNHDHWCGTAKMGSSSDPMAVVDNHLRVFNVKNLRVVDASIIPTIPNSLLHATVMAIAEHAADIILGDH